MSDSPYTAYVPQPSTPFLDPATGALSTAWWFWFLRMQARTGGGVGIGSPELLAQLNIVTVGLANEVAARLAADAAETAARIAADAVLQAEIDTINSTGLGRMQAEALVSWGF